MDVWIALVWICSVAATSMNMCEPITKQMRESRQACQVEVRDAIARVVRNGTYPSLPGPWIIRGQCIVEEAYVRMALPKPKEEGSSDVGP